MKKFIFSGIFSVLILAIFAQTNVPNGNFEKWDTLFNPDNFATSNNLSYGLTGVANVTKTTDKYHLQYAVRMETSNNFAGYIISGKVGLKLNGGLGDAGGIPYTTVPDSFIAYIKYNCTAPDTGVIAIIFKKAGIPIALPTIYGIKGTSNNYERISIPVNKPPFPVSPDSVVIAFCSSMPNSVNLHNGNWLTVDDIVFMNKSGSPAAIPNNDFENWTSVLMINPDGWNSINFFSVYLGIAPSVVQSTSSHGGKYAANITTLDYNFGTGSNKMGVLTNSPINSNNESGFKLTTIPDSIGFWYKYDNSKNSLDSAVFEVDFLKYNSTSMISSIVDSYLVILPASAVYKNRIIPFKTISGKNPDTANILIFSSNLNDTIHVGVGNNITVDDITFYFAGVGIPSDFVINNIKMYPNPATENIHLNLTLPDNMAALNFTIFDLNGKQIVEKTFKGLAEATNEFNIDVSKLVTGEYILNINSGDKIIFNKKFEIIK